MGASGCDNSGRFQADGLHRYRGFAVRRVPLRVMLSPGSFAQIWSLLLGGLFGE